MASFDYVFPQHSSQKDVFESVGLPMIDDVLLGYNGTLFCYGQTGSGKTYSMMGVNIYDEQSRGIIPRAAEELFCRVEDTAVPTQWTFKCSMVEVYKEKLNDLLNPQGQKLKIKEDPRKGIFVEGLKQVCVESQDELLEVISLGEQMRTVAATHWNAVSSRSHQIFMLEVEQLLESDIEKKGILNLVDLAGSEKVTFHGMSESVLEEAKKINLSLSALGNVIYALTQGYEHIPYRDSKLTRLLQESLGGNYKTTVLITLSPCCMAIDESISTLKFAQRVKRIKNCAKVNVKRPVEEYITAIAQLRQELAKVYKETALLRSQLDFSRSPSQTQVELSLSPSSSQPSVNLPCLDSISPLEFSPSPLTEKLRICRNTWDVSIGRGEEKERRYSEPMVREASEKQKTAVLKTYQEEVQRLTRFYENRDSLQAVKTAALSNELDSLRSLLKSMQEQLTKAKLSLLKTETACHQLKEDNERLKLQFSIEVQKIEYFREKAMAKGRVVEELSGKLGEMEEKCRQLMGLNEGEGVSTEYEFEEVMERSEDTPVTTEDEEMWIDLLYSLIKVNCMGESPYLKSVERLLENQSQLNWELELFKLRCGLLTAAQVNCGLGAMVHTLSWKNSLWRQKYEQTKQKCEYQQNTIAAMETIIDTLHESYVQIARKVERFEPGDRLKSSVLSQKEGKAFVRKCVRMPTNIDHHPRIPSLLSNFASDESLHRNPVDPSFSLQCASLQHLHQALSQAQLEVQNSNSMVEALEVSSVERARREGAAWTSCIVRTRKVYERELLRKQREVEKLCLSLSAFASDQAKRSLDVTIVAEETVRREKGRSIRKCEGDEGVMDTEEI